MQIFGVVFQGTKQQLNGQKWDVELGHLPAFLVECCFRVQCLEDSSSLNCLIRW